MVNRRPTQCAWINRHDGVTNRGSLTRFEERVVFESKVRTGQGNTNQFDHQRQHHALGAADGRHAAGERGSGIGGRRTAGIQGPADRNGFPLFGGEHDLAARNLGQRKVDHQRRI